MTSLAQFLYPLPARRSVPGIVTWWERRRPAFNLIIGGAGMLTLAVIAVASTLPPFSGPLLPPWQFFLAYGLGANACYTAGCFLEVAAERIWGRDLLPIGPALYRMGLTFSLGLTLLPAIVLPVLWVMGLIISLV